MVEPELHHDNLKTIRLQKMIDWYKVVIGGSAICMGPRNAWMINNDVNHRIAFLLAPTYSDIATT
jgi:hypothetical protein